MSPKSRTNPRVRQRLMWLFVSATTLAQPLHFARIFGRNGGRSGSCGVSHQHDLLPTDYTDTGTLAPFGGTAAATEATTAALPAHIADALEEAGISRVVENPPDAALLDEEDHTTFGLGDTASGTERLIDVDFATPTTTASVDRWSTPRFTFFSIAEAPKTSMHISWRFTEFPQKQGGRRRGHPVEHRE